MDWKALENRVRSIAEAKWSSTCRSEEICGVQIDGVLKVRSDYWILIEVSKSSTLAKVRTDLAKFGVVKPGLLAKGIYAECHFVTENSKHPSINVTAKEFNVETHTLESFANKYLGSKQYITERLKLPFGSAVIPESGTPDDTNYTPINYVDKKGKKYTISDISDAIRAKKHVVLLGEFGTGKSRCLKEVFNNLIINDEEFAPMAINLRENWGINSMSLMVRNHLESIGFGEDVTGSVLKSIRSGGHPILLDGFDEIGSQSWSGEASRLVQTRRLSLQGVRDVISSSSENGLLITGREHYFSSEKEMLSCLGLDDRPCLILTCPEEFSEVEAKAYLSREAKDLALPDWLPRKPLVCQLLSKLEPAELQALNNGDESEVDFFDRVLDAVCRRETRIHGALDAAAIRAILLHLAQESRSQYEGQESLSPQEINDAFYAITGVAPIDESAQMLQRLPYLGRVGSGGVDRIFIDDYAKNGIRGLAASEALQQAVPHVRVQVWKQPLSDFGIRVLAQKLDNNKAVLKYVSKCVDHGNSQLAADFVASRISNSGYYDFENLTIDNASISSIDFSGVTVENLTLLNIDFNNVSIEDAKFNNVFIDHCIINVLSVANPSGSLPESFGVNCSVEDFRHALTTTSISGLPLSPSQKTLLAMIKKLFFQKGSGRKEEALLRGAEGYWDAKSAESIIGFMLRKGLISKYKGDSGLVYAPKRKYMKRMNLIIEQQKHSTDELWNLVS